MSEWNAVHHRNGTERHFLAWRSGGELYLKLKEYSLTHYEKDRVKVVDDTQSYPLADDGQTVAHDGRRWKDYAEARFKRLNNKRFRT